jgi:hypothetical protein
VLKLLDDNKDNPDVAELIKEINDLKVTFDKITITSSKITPVPDEESNVTILKSQTQVNITQDVFRELSAKVSALRTNFIS